MMNSLENIRQKNIERNKELMKKLNLENIASSINTSKKPSPTKANSRPKSRPRTNQSIPTRRSKRLSTAPGDAQEKALEEERIAKELSSHQRLKELRSSRLDGNFKIRDLLADPKSGTLYEEDIIYGQSETVYVASDLEVEERHPGMSRGLSVLHEAGQSIASDLEVSKEDESLRADLNDGDSKKFSEMSIHNVNDPSRTRMTPHRITSIQFHSSSSVRLAFAGDTNGCLGIWPVDEKSENGDPVVVSTKPHGRAVSKIVNIPQKGTQIATASYDGSCRVLDLVKQEFVECVTVSGETEDVVAISDINWSTPNTLYATTLDGLFFQHDTRQSPKEIRFRSLRRLHDKKIGGFSINPSDGLKIATASLDRSVKIWDLRSMSKRNSSSKIADGLASPQSCGEFVSKLSVSNVDWNSNHRLVCNGYDDTIRLFDVSHASESELSPRGRRPQVFSTWNISKAYKEVRHNCQTGRWVSILKARWQTSPMDGIQKFAIGNMRRCIDIYAEDGTQIASLASPEVMSAVPAVVALHPTQNWLVGGTSSGKVFIFN